MPQMKMDKLNKRKRKYTEMNVAEGIDQIVDAELQKEREILLTLLQTERALMTSFIDARFTARQVDIEKKGKKMND
ncbi:hypothetical protein L195_g051355, partial [Trifolium pratense]